MAHPEVVKKSHRRGAEIARIAEKEKHIIVFAAFIPGDLSVLCPSAVSFFIFRCFQVRMLFGVKDASGPVHFNKRLGIPDPCPDLSQLRGKIISLPSNHIIRGRNSI